MSENLFNHYDIRQTLGLHAGTIRLWLKYLEEIETKYNVKCVLAGGCFRDLLLGVPIKDLDVFIIAKADTHLDIEATEYMYDGVNDIFKTETSPSTTVKWRRVVNLDYEKMT